eukprot:6202020-Pleurochrysis_carterae.AAC.2
MGQESGQARQGPLVCEAAHPSASCDVHTRTFCECVHRDLAFTPRCLHARSEAGCAQPAHRRRLRSARSMPQLFPNCLAPRPVASAVGALMSRPVYDWEQVVRNVELVT